MIIIMILIEMTQYITGLGIAEFDDVFGNTLGGWIGVVVAWIWNSRIKALRSKKKLLQKPIMRDMMT